METRFEGLLTLNRAPQEDEPTPLSAPPPARLKSVEPECPVRWSSLSGYRIEGSDVVFVFAPELHREHDRAADPVRVAGPFNDWTPDAPWTLSSTVERGLPRLLLRVPLARVCPDGRIPADFKFVSASGFWFRPHDRAPNRVSDNAGHINLLLDPALTGRHLIRFAFAKPVEPDRAIALAWGDGPGNIILTATPGEAFLDLWNHGPLGASVSDDSTRFRLFAPRATGVLLETISPDGRVRAKTSLTHAGDGAWEAVRPGNLHDWHYRYFVSGTNRDSSTAFDAEEPVTDPYALAMAGPSGPGVIVDIRKIPSPRKPYTPPEPQNLVIAETHLVDLLGLDAESASGTRPGYRELAAFVRRPDCPLRTLGVNAVELMPVQESETPPPETRPAGYHWGYMPVNWFAPGSHFATHPERASQIEEFRDLVNAFHEAGIAVILDVVYNHLGSPNALLRLDKHHYFTEGPDDTLTNWSGCGNDFRAETPMGLRLITDSLKHWVTTYDVDGFRFDLAELLGTRVLREIRAGLAPLKKNLVLIAEPWSFRGHIGDALRGAGYASWNDGYRDFFARFVRGEGSAEELVHRLSGSPGQFAAPTETVNYTESHDDRCWIDRITENPGHDGTHATPADIARTRLMFACLFASLGTPMIAAGQEFLRSKGGANNTYLRGDLSRLTPERLAEHADTREYVRGWIALRRSDIGRSLRRPEPAGPGFFRQYRGRDNRTLALLYNGEHALAETPLIFAANPTPHPVDIACDWPELGLFRLFADNRCAGIKPLQERADGPKRIPGGFRLPPLSSGLWALA